MCRNLFTLLLGGIFLCTGCGRTTTYTGPNGEKATVTQKGDKVDITISGDKGGTAQYAASEKGISLPANFPQDTPTYPGAIVTMNTSSPDGMMVMFKTNDSTDKVKEFYEGKLKEQGWEQQASMNTPQGVTIVNKKGERELSVNILGGDQTTIHMIISEKK
jgi:hypothetical protein